ncbi:MAG TPA: transposase [Candidatus Moranbacteria bacterium]|nr:transposase [Candidatus Moranbacteria bacterium]
MSEVPKMPDIPEEERNPFVVQLLEVIRYQSELIQRLKDEIAILKGDKPRPKIKPSGMEKGEKENGAKESSDGKRPGSFKRSKTKELKIHKVIPIPPENIPKGSTFKGYKEFVVQGIIIQPYNTLYRLERWKTPDGRYIEGQLPPYVQGHFDPSLISYIQYQYFQCHVTQPLLLEQLREFVIDISSGQISRILIEGHDDFHAEKDEILSTGLEISSYINVDDTGARHKGNNGVCTHIGNELFAWFESTDSKSRINLLTLLGAGKNDYILNSYALDYMESQKLAKMQLQLLIQCNQKIFTSSQEWNSNLKILGITNTRHIRIATEGALIGGLIENGLNPDLAILSDDAGQFNILLHALCWVHAERTIHKIVPYTDEQRSALESTRDKIWKLYADLKAYKKNPTAENKIELENRFDGIFRENPSFITLNLALKRLYENKPELLLVLDRPEIPLHNNASESDIREYAKRRKISGGTKSSSGRKSRDTFTSLKKTCRKLKVSFWEYLNDRNFKRNSIQRLSELMRKMAFAPP